MAFEQIEGAAVAAMLREMILLYAAGGAGKTRLATSLTQRYGKIAYIALDEGSENLDSVLAKYRDRITVFRPSFVNPIVDAGEIVSRNWKKEGFDTLVIDTFSNLTYKLLAFIANKGMFSSNHVQIGDPNSPLGQSLPDRGDYGGVHAIVRNFVSALFNNQKELNIILVCHQETDEEAKVGGPSTVGRAMIAWLPARFKTVIHIDREVENKIVNGVLTQIPRYVAWTAPHGAWISRINEANLTGNPMSRVVLNVDPINFWEQYDKLKGVQ